MERAFPGQHFPAIDLIIGHADETMASRYRERISEERLVAVTDYVHGPTKLPTA